MYNRVHWQDTVHVEIILNEHDMDNITEQLTCKDHMARSGCWRVGGTLEVLVACRWLTGGADGVLVMADNI